MVKNVTIAENGTPKNFNNVEEIKTNQLDGNTQAFVPKNSIKIASVTVRKNGTYTAKRLGLTCISSVTVKRPSKGKNIEVGEVETSKIDPVKLW